MSLRDWLIVAGVVALIGILADGIRRVRSRNKLRLDIDNQFENLPEEDFHGELPNGGARISDTDSACLNATEQQRDFSAVSEAAPTISTEPVTEGQDDIDLLLDGGLKGVGEGADSWLGDAAEPVDHRAESQQRAPDSYELSGDEEQSVDPIDEQVAQDYSRVEPSISENDLLDSSSSTAEKPSSVGAAGDFDAVKDEGLGEGIISPVRVRKVQQPEVAESIDDVDSGGISSDQSLRQQDEQVETVDYAAPAEPVFEAAQLEDIECQDSLVKTEPVQGRESDDFLVLPEQDRVASVALVSEDSLDLSQPVTVLLDQMKSQDGVDPVDIPQENIAGMHAAVDKPQHEESAAIVSDDITAELHLEPQLDPEELAIETELGALSTAVEDKPPVVKKAKKKSRIRRLRDEIQTSLFDMDPDFAPEPAAVSKPKKKQSKRLAKKVAAKSEPEQLTNTRSEEPEESPVLVISVAGRQPLNGKMLFKLVEACGMEFGEMKIFHRHEDGPNQGSVQFSMANAIKPGYFEIDEKENFSTPAVTFFLEMSQPRDLMNAFECMLGTAQAVSENLDGVMKDENRSVLRPQTIEHYRQQVRDFERRRLAKRA